MICFSLSYFLFCFVLFYISLFHFYPITIKIISFSFLTLLFFTLPYSILFYIHFSITYIILFCFMLLYFILFYKKRPQSLSWVEKGPWGHFSPGSMIVNKDGSKITNKQTNTHTHTRRPGVVEWGCGLFVCLFGSLDPSCRRSLIQDWRVHKVLSPLKRAIGAFFYKIK